MSRTRIQSGHTEAPLPGGSALLVHGGAWAIPDEAVAAHRDGLRQALETGRALLERGAPAVDVAAETVAVLEAHEAFDAGRGAVLGQDGRASLDAGLMDGGTLAWGAVAAVRRIAHPIRVARRLLDHDGQARLLVAEGAERFAEAEGFPLVDNDVLIVPREQARFEALKAGQDFHTSRAFSGDTNGAPVGTVGCVARDAAGRLAAATSTGGAPFTLPGRVGDSPLVGCGYYASGAGAASATGWGEAIAAVGLCIRCIDSVSANQKAPEAICRDRLRHLAEAIANPAGEPATAGLLLLAADGQGGWAFSTPRMARGGWHVGGEPWTAC